MKPLYILGDFMWDHWYVVKPKGVPSAEQPGMPIWVHDPDIYVQDGGAGNVALNLTSLMDIIPVRKSTESIQPDGSLRIYLGSTKRRYIYTNGNQVFRVDADLASGDPLKNPSINELNKLYSGVVIVDYAKGSVTSDTIGHYAQASLKIPVFCHSKQFTGEVAGWYWFMNHKEFVAMSKPVYPKGVYVITNGANGIKTIDHIGDRNYQSYQANGIPAKVVSVCGAGDSAMAGFIAEYYSQTAKYDINGINRDVILQECTRIANCAGAAAVSGPMTSVVTMKQIKEIYESNYNRFYNWDGSRIGGRV